MGFAAFLSIGDEQTDSCQSKKREHLCLPAAWCLSLLIFFQVERAITSLSLTSSTADSLICT